MVGYFFRHKATGIKAQVAYKTYNSVYIRIPYHTFLIAWNLTRFQKHFEKCQSGFDF